MSRRCTESLLPVAKDAAGVFGIGFQSLIAYPYQRTTLPLVASKQTLVTTNQQTETSPYEDASAFSASVAFLWKLFAKAFISFARSILRVARA